MTAPLPAPLVAWRWVDPFTIATALAVGYGIGWGADAFPTDVTGTSGIGYAMVILGVAAAAGAVLVAAECVASIGSLRRSEGIQWRRRLVDVRVVLDRPGFVPATMVIGLPLVLIAAGFLVPGPADDSSLGLTGIAIDGKGHQQIVVYACGDKLVTDIQITRSVSYWKNGDVPTLGPFVLKSPRSGLLRLDLQAPGALWNDHAAVRIPAHDWFAIAEGGKNGTQGTDEVGFTRKRFAEIKPGNIYVLDKAGTALTSLPESSFIDRAKQACDAGS